MDRVPNIYIVYGIFIYFGRIVSGKYKNEDTMKISLGASEAQLKLGFYSQQVHYRRHNYIYKVFKAAENIF